MRQEIKHRIEQIRRGEVPPGYKRSKVGIVPEEWGECRFRNVFSRLTRKNTEGNTNVLTISAQHGLINQERFFNKPVASDDKSSYYLLYYGEFAYNKSYSNGYPYGAIKRLDMYGKGIVSPLYICFSIDNPSACAEYFMHYFEAGLLNSEIKAVAQEGARNHGLLNIAVDDFFSMHIVQPPLSEQQKIAEILSAQDRLISLLERKSEQLKRLKKVFLQRLFPQKGADVPEWRFPGFEGEWERKKVSELCIIATGSSNTQDQAENGIYPFYIRSEYPVRSNKYLFDEEAVITIGDGNIGKVFHYINGKYDLHQRCYKMANFKGVSGVYFYYFFSAMFYSRVIRMSAKATVDSVRHDMIADMKVFFPTSHAEQACITDIISSLDRLITLNQSKYDTEKKKKKALMQMLLTGIVRVKV